MSKQKNQLNDLLAAIKRQPTEATPPPASERVAPSEVELHQEAASKRTVKRSKATDAEKHGRKGKQTQFWLHDVDRKLIRELSAWLAGQGLRPTDSMVIRAALRMAETGSGLLEAYWEAAKVDGRLKRD